MHNIDDCLFRTSFSISIQGDADLSDFETRMERSYQQFAQTYCRYLINSSPKVWRILKHNEVRQITPNHGKVVDIILKVLKDRGDNVDRIRTELAESVKIPIQYFSDDLLREAFAHALNEGLALISYSDIRFKNCALVVSCELENSQTIYQYNWRSRWALILVNSLKNSSKTSIRNFLKAAVLIRHFRKRLLKRRWQRA